MKDKFEEERKKFEAAGTKLHGWDKLDYRLSGALGKVDYIWSTQRLAFALWLHAKGIAQ